MEYKSNSELEECETGDDDDFRERKSGVLFHTSSVFRSLSFISGQAKEFRHSKHSGVRKRPGSRYIILPILPTMKATITREELEHRRIKRELDVILRENEEEIARQKQRRNRLALPTPRIPIYKLTESYQDSVGKHTGLRRWRYSTDENPASTPDYSRYASQKWYLPKGGKLPDQTG